MRALAHPLRLKLLELATREGTLTSTRAAEATGESTASCSFHLRQLAKYGFIEEAEGGRGRERPWRPVVRDTRWSALQPDREASAAADALTAHLLGRDLSALRDFLDRRANYPAEWQEAGGLISTSLLYLRVEELEQLTREYLELLRRYADRTADTSLRPEEALPVRLVVLAAPLPDDQ
jgi:predicted ArsR family transcriptional regulator